MTSKDSWPCGPMVLGFLIVAAFFGLVIMAVS